MGKPTRTRWSSFSASYPQLLGVILAKTPALSISGKNGGSSCRKGRKSIALGCWRRSFFLTLPAVAGRGYRPVPECFRELASRAADRAGYPGFMPDACLINRYAPGTKLTLHQDRDERDY